jgi:hypothetical protein
MRINVKATLKKVAEDKLKPKPIPKIRLKQSTAETHIEKPRLVIKADSSHAIEILNKTLVSTLWTEYHIVSTEQKKLSTAIAALVKEDATTERLKKQYDDIDNYQPQLQALRDKIYYAEIHGELPPAPDEEIEVNDINALKVKAKSLVEKRSKLRKKLELKVAKNPERFVSWEKDLAIADIEWQEVQRRINELMGK